MYVGANLVGIWVLYPHISMTCSRRESCVCTGADLVGIYTSEDKTFLTPVRLCPPVLVAVLLGCRVPPRVSRVSPPDSE